MRTTVLLAVALLGCKSEPVEIVPLGPSYTAKELVTVPDAVEFTQHLMPLGDAEKTVFIRWTVEESVEPPLIPNSTGLQLERVSEAKNGSATPLPSELEGGAEGEAPVPAKPPVDGAAEPDAEPEYKAFMVEKLVLDENGLAHGAYQVQDAWTTYTLKPELKATMKIGETWSTAHMEASETFERDCVVEETPFCDEGVAVACTEWWPARTFWLRHHWCVGVGWVGYDSLDVRPWGAMHTWSSDVTREGAAQPSAPTLLRQTPDPESLKGKGDPGPNPHAGE